MKPLFFICFLLWEFVAQAQANKTDAYSLRFSAGRVNFGSGDILGYGLGMEVGKYFGKVKSNGRRHFQTSAELFFENGVTDLPSPDVQYRFRQVAGFSFWPKFTLLPIATKRIDLRLQAGPFGGHYNRSQEGQIRIGRNALGEAVRQSTLLFDNGFVYGYRISASMDLSLSRRWRTGFRVDFSNNNEAEINTFIGLRAGIDF